jgi:uncharacterized membrane protein YbhN (UPF0104 family)
MKISRRQAGALIKNFVIPTAVLVAIVAVFFHDVSIADIRAGFARIPFTYILAFILLWLLGSVLRAWQYSVLLSGKLAGRDIFLITLVRNFSVDLLPGRAAALGFYSWLTRKKGIALEEAASSFVIGVFYDSIALALMLGGLLFFLESGRNRWLLVAGMAIILILSALVILFSHHFLAFLLRPGTLGKLRLARLQGAVGRAHDYLLEHCDNRQRLKLIVISLVIRLCKYIYNFILFEGVLHLGAGLKNFSLFSFGLAATELSSLFPLQGPAGFGTWELTFALVFSALQVPAANIKEAGIVIHVTSQAWEYAVGLLALAYLAFRGNRERRP